MTAAELLAQAREVLDGAVPMPGISAPRAAALLARQALEEALHEWSREVCPGLEYGRTRSQLICLRELGDRTRWSAAQRAWDGLSRACHHHAYELTPTDAEVRQLLGLVGVLATVEGLRAAG